MNEEKWYEKAWRWFTDKCSVGSEVWGTMSEPQRGLLVVTNIIVFFFGLLVGAIL